MDEKHKMKSWGSIFQTEEMNKKEVYGTHRDKFDPPTGTDCMMKNGQSTTISTSHICISAMKIYETKSLEELRWDDYQYSQPVVQRDLKNKTTFSDLQDKNNNNQQTKPTSFTTTGKPSSPNSLFSTISHKPESFFSPKGKNSSISLFTAFNESSFSTSLFGNTKPMEITNPSFPVSSTIKPMTSNSKSPFSSTIKPITANSASRFLNTNKPMTTDSKSQFSSTNKPITTDSKSPFSSTIKPITSNSDTPFSSTNKPMTTNSDSPFSSTNKPMTIDSKSPFSSTSNPMTTISDIPFSSTNKPMTTNSDSSFSSTNKPLTTNSDSLFSSTNKPITSNYESPFSSTNKPLTTNSDSLFSGTNKPITSNYESPFSSTSKPMKTIWDSPFSSTSKPRTTNSASLFSSTNKPVTSNLVLPLSSTNEFKRCNYHSKKNIEFLCLDCSETCCSICLFQHKWHDWEPLEDTTMKPSPQHRADNSITDKADDPVNIQSQIRELEDSISKLETEKSNVNTLTYNEIFRIQKEYGLLLLHLQEEEKTLLRNITDERDEILNILDKLLKTLRNLKDEAEKSQRFSRLSLKISKLSEKGFENFRKKVKESKAGLNDVRNVELMKTKLHMNKDYFSDLLRCLKNNDQLNISKANLSEETNLENPPGSKSEKLVDAKCKGNGSDNSHELKTPQENLKSDSHVSIKITNPKYVANNTKDEINTAFDPVKTFSEIPQKSVEDIMKNIRRRTLNQKTRLQNMKLNIKIESLTDMEPSGQTRCASVESGIRNSLKANGEFLMDMQSEDEAWTTTDFYFSD